ncbi:hypothetical protein DdX_00461 [Ditylenchus destructor]|uniref:Uncharacterized protein n=1 Tax=Ditylenchus destructor TaxID=166010 RepID=A0AAD4NJY2_9BILA|nr:hypothetical protein DdX_00461 [Ditylenchus destructor]
MQITANALVCELELLLGKEEGGCDYRSSPPLSDQQQPAGIRTNLAKIANGDKKTSSLHHTNTGEYDDHCQSTALVLPQPPIPSSSVVWEKAWAGCYCWGMALCIGERGPFSQQCWAAFAQPTNTALMLLLCWLGSNGSGPQPTASTQAKACLCVWGIGWNMEVPQPMEVFLS